MVAVWKILYTKRSQDDAKKLKKCGLAQKAQQLLEFIAKDPYQNPPNFEKLFGLENIYSRRINIQHRLVYEVKKEEKTIVIKMMYKHYGD